MEIAILPIRADHVFATGMDAAGVCVGAGAASRGAAAAAAGDASSPTGVSLTFSSNVGGSSGGAASPATESGAGALPAGEPAPLSPGAEGEICMRGRHVMVGYRGDEANSAQAIDAFGWLHSGDIGRLDAEGYLTITGRIKELIKTAGGENVPPVLIENTVKEELPVLSQCVVVGDRRKFLTCLLALRCRVDAAGNPTEELESACVAELRAAGSTATTVGEAAACPAVARYIDAGIARANKRAISNACALQKWRVLPRDMSVAGGELTATMKLKRSEVFKQNAALIEGMYAE
jgi:long-chain-fatty-acid--CoA ligase ACSBG